MSGESADCVGVSRRMPEQARSPLRLLRRGGRCGGGARFPVPALEARAVRRRKPVKQLSLNPREFGSSGVEVPKRSQPCFPPTWLPSQWRTEPATVHLAVWSQSGQRAPSFWPTNAPRNSYLATARVCRSRFSSPPFCAHCLAHVSLPTRSVATASAENGSNPRFQRQTTRLQAERG